MYEIPPKRRRMVTLDDVEDAAARAEFRADLLALIESDDEIRAAILDLASGAPKARQKRPTTMPARTRARGGR